MQWNATTRRRVCLGLQIAVASALLLPAIFLRFYHLAENGLWGSDAVYYTQLAKAWSEGDFVTHIGEDVRVYRPVALWLFGSALEVFGDHDDSIKRLNAIAGSICIAVVFLIARRWVDRRFWPALVIMATYAFLPTAIQMARIELTHTLSTLMVLLSLWAFVESRDAASGDALIRPKACLLLVGCGVFTAFAALTHQDLLLIAPGYAGFLVVDQLRHWRRPKPWLELALLTVTTSALALPMILFTLRNHNPLVFEADLTVTARLLRLPEHVGRYLWSSMLALSSATLLLVFLLLVVVALVLCRRVASLEIPRILYLPLALVVSYLGFVGYAVDDLPTRVFLPLIPVVQIAVGAWCWHLTKRVGKRYADAATAVLAAVLIFSGFAYFPGFGPRQGHVYARTWAPLTLETDAGAGVSALSQYITARRAPAWWYDFLADKVHAEARLLVASSLMLPDPGRRVLQTDFYLGDNAIYVVDHSEPLDELIRQRRIRYVLVSRYFAALPFLENETYTRYEYGGKWRRTRLELGKPYGFAAGEYTLEREFRFLVDYLERREAHLVFAGGKARRHVDSDRAGLVETLLGPGISYVIYELQPLDHQEAIDHGRMAAEKPGADR